MKQFAKIMGTTFAPKSKEIIPLLKKGQELTLEREPSNKFDEFAIIIKYNNDKLGYVPGYLSRYYSDIIDANKTVKCFVSEVTGGGDKNYGCNIEIHHDEEIQDSQDTNYSNLI